MWKTHLLTICVTKVELLDSFQEAVLVRRAAFLISTDPKLQSIS